MQELPVVFKHMPKNDVQKFFELAFENKRSDAECLLDLVESWDADMELSIDSINQLFQNYRDSAKEVFNTYMHELIDARLGN